MHFSSPMHATWPAHHILFGLITIKAFDEVCKLFRDTKI